MYWLFTPSKAQRKVLIGSWSVGVLAGIGLVRVGLTFHATVWLLLAVLLIATSLKRPRIAMGYVLVSGLLIGNWQGTTLIHETAAIDTFIGQKVVAIGVISEDPTYGKRNERRFYIENAQINGRKAPGKIRVSSFAPLSVKRGDYIQVSGKLASGFGPYQARISYASVTGYTEGKSIVLRMRDMFASGVRNAIPEPQASLGLGFLLGQKSSLPAELDENMRAVGLTHIVVASGYNLTILVRLARRLFADISKYQALVWSLGLTAGFVAVTGFSPSMTRAAFVTCLSVGAWYYGRKIHPIVLLLFAAAVTGLINPLFVWADIGWYLSFLAFAGVLILAPLLMRRIWGDAKPSFVAQVATETFAAQLLTLPLIMFVFGEASLLSLLANVLIVPLIPLAMVTTFVAGIFGMIAPTISGWIGILPSALVWYMIEITELLAGLSWSRFKLEISSAVMLLLYLCIVLLGVILLRRTRYNLLQSNITD